MKYLCYRLLSIVMVLAFTSVLAAQPKLDLNDVSWLWPVPETNAGLARVISMDSLKSPGGDDVWSDSQFEDILKLVDSGKTEVDSTEVDFGPEIRQKSVWRIAGMRVDPSTPGCDLAVRDAFGSATQIRLIVQPVTQSGGQVKVHDVAVHLVYQWITGVDDKNRKKPDDEKFKQIVADLDQLKKLSTDGGAPTAGVPLGVHPGLKSNAAGLDSEIKKFLGKHLTHEKLDSMALMGIQRGIEPWIFVATKRLPDGHFGIIPIPIPAASPQMIDFRAPGGKVSPTPIVNNRSPITPQLIVPEDQRRGVATAALFPGFGIDLDEFAAIGKDASGNVVLDAEVRNRDIPDVIANPHRSHFFNTDCISCHTESTRRESFRLGQGDFAFKPDGNPPEIESTVKPRNSWNVRNFGWFPPHFFTGGGPTVASVSQRTANESAEVVDFIERNFRSND